MLQKKSLEQREHGNAKQIIFSETPSDDTLQGFSIAINEDSESEDSTVSAAFAPYRVRPFEFAPTLYRVRPHTFRVYGGELEGANSIGANAVQFDSTDDEESRHHQRFLPVSSNLPRT